MFVKCWIRQAQQGNREYDARIDAMMTARNAFIRPRGFSAFQSVFGRGLYLPFEVLALDGDVTAVTMPKLDRPMDSEKMTSDHCRVEAAAEERGDQIQHRREIAGKRSLEGSSQEKVKKGCVRTGALVPDPTVEQSTA